MYTKIATIAILALAMIGMTGFAAAMDTNVQYNGDGSYYCNYNAYGTGTLGIHTYTSDGQDHLMTGWTNSQATGWQQMDTYSGTSTTYNTDYSGTVISREATVGGVNAGGSEAGYIQTITTDNAGNLILTYADYRDNKGYGSHVTTEQTVVAGSLVDIFGSQYTVTGVVAETNIHGFSYGSDTTVSGYVMTKTGEEYTYVLLAMDNGRMDLYTISAAGSVTPVYNIPTWIVDMGVVFGIEGVDLLYGGVIDGACGQYVYVDAEGTGNFTVGAGTDMHGMEFYMYDKYGDVDYHSSGLDVTVDMNTAFENTWFNADGYIYAVNLTANPVP